MSCEVCELLKGKTMKIYEDAIMIALLTSRPAGTGHIQVIPKEHYAIIEQVPDYIIEQIFKIVNKISSVVFEVLKAQGTNLIITNGVSAGQKYNHFLVNIIPRAQGDGMNFEWPAKQISEEEMTTIESELKEETKKIGDFQGKPAETIEIKEETETIDSEDNYLWKHINRIP